MSSKADLQKPPYSMNRTFLVESDVTAVAGDPVITLAVDDDYSQCYIAVSYYDGIDGNTLAIPGAGTETYTVQTLVQPGIDQSLGTALNSVDPTQEDYTGHITQVEVTLAGVTTATHAVLRVSQNSS